MASNHSITQAGRDEPFFFQLGRNQIGGHRPVFKYGANAAVGTSAEHIWLQGATYTWQPTATVVSVTSSDANDDGAPVGTGALTVTLEGLDANYAEISETVTLNGTTVVDTTASFLRLHRMYVATAGTGLTNAGVIYAAVTGDVYTTPGIPDTTADIMSTIGAAEGQTLQAFYTVPAGYTAYMTAFNASTGDIVNSCTVSLKKREVGGAFRTAERLVVLGNSFTSQHDVPLSFVAKTDIEVTGVASASTVNTAASFDLILVAD